MKKLEKEIENLIITQKTPLEGDYESFSIKWLKDHLDTYDGTITSYFKAETKDGRKTYYVQIIQKQENLLYYEIQQSNNNKEKKTRQNLDERNFEEVDLPF